MLVRLKSNECAAVLDTLGGELCSYIDGNKTEYIWQGDAKIWSGKNPLLFPVVGALKDGRIEIGGSTYEMARHGFARRSEFKIAEQTDEFAVFELCESPETREKYPFAFNLKVRHELVENGFATTFIVKNTDNVELPFCIGAHTAFNCPLYKGERFEDYVIKFDAKETAPSRALTAEGCLKGAETFPCLVDSDEIELRHEIFDKVDTLIFDTLKSTAASLVNPATGHGVRVEFEGFPMLGIWTMPHANGDYICIEPWHGCAAVTGESGKLEDKLFCVRLAPDEVFTLGYRVLALV